MAEIPALAALSALFAFPTNPPARTVDVIKLTHTVGVARGEYTFQPKAGRNAFLRTDSPLSGNMVKSGEIGIRKSAEMPLRIPPKMAKIPALAALIPISAFPRNLPAPRRCCIDGQTSSRIRRG